MPSPIKPPSISSTSTKRVTEVAAPKAEKVSSGKKLSAAAGKVDTKTTTGISRKEANAVSTATRAAAIEAADRLAGATAGRVGGSGGSGGGLT